MTWTDYMKSSRPEVVSTTLLSSDSGLRVEKSRTGGPTVVSVHYSCDPDKDKKWVAEQRSGCATEEQWAQEYELSFD